MKLIGLTGGVGSGKSTVAGMFRDLGAVVLDADQATHDLYEPGSLAFDMIEGEFGSEYIRDGRIDRARLGELVFNNADARQKLNAIMHPLVREWMAARTTEALMHGASVVTQTLVARASAAEPHGLVPVAVTILVLPPQTAVTVLL